MSKLYRFFDTNKTKTNLPNTNLSVPSEISLSALKIILYYMQTLKQQRSDKTGSICVFCEYKWHFV